MLLGSARLLIQRGSSESRAGRFEVIHLPHWSAGKMHAAFGWTLDEFVFFGGCPGSALLARDHTRWTRYVRDSLIETTISRDVLLMARVDKPAPLRRLFELGNSECSKERETGPRVPSAGTAAGGGEEVSR